MYTSESDPDPPEENLGAGEVPASVKEAVRRITEAQLAEVVSPPEHYRPPPELLRAVLAVLRPAGLRQRLRRRISGGLTAFQILDRLPPQWQRRLAEGQELPVLARRQAVRAVEQALYELGQQGRVQRRRVDMAMELPGKGMRQVQIDAYRLS